MILSKYCKIFPYKEEPDSLVLFSTKSASIIQVPESVLEDIKKDNLSDDETRDLSELGVLVNNQGEEKNEILHFMDDLNAMHDKFSAIVVMNLDCNLACKYCFEGSRKGRHYMTRETADLLVEYIRQNVLPRKKELSLTFYGGEPLLSTELIMHISEKLKAVAESSGAIYNAGLITNGTLLTSAVAEKLKTVGLTKASITLDGPQKVHDEYRPFKSGKGSFNAIVKNVKGICDIIEVQLGGNFTKTNYRDFPYLLDYLMENGLTPDKIPDIQFYPVAQEMDGIAPPDFHGGCETTNEPWLAEASILLREATLQRGYRTGKITPTACMVECKDKLVVNHDGSIYKCPGFIGREQFKVGDLNSGIKDYRASHSLDNWKNAMCLECEYLPLCFGGCRYLKLIRDGNMNEVDCKRPYLDAVLEHLVMQDIKYGVRS